MKIEQPQTISDYTILGYTDKDKQELENRKIACKIIDIQKRNASKFAKFIVQNSKSF